jgi:tetratricopeptide (TPR) repeat protein
VSALRWALAASCLSITSVAAAANPAWHPIDAGELERVRDESFQAANSFESAEQKLVTGDLVGAEKDLAEARAKVPNSWLLGRRHCQVLTELGRRAEAKEACQVALGQATAMDSRAFVGALMAKPDMATPRELVEAVRQVVSARRLQQQPFSDAALCEIAHHIGDDAMLNLCVENLQRVAPQNFETLRWQAVRKQAPLWALWLGWLPIAGAVVLTAGHALWRWLRSPAKARSAAAVAALLLVVVTPGAGHAQSGTPEPGASAAAVPASPQKWQLSRFPINHDNPESLIPSIEERNADPLEFGYFLQDLNTEAMKAEGKGDYRAALKYWRASAKAVPDMAVSFGKACRCHDILGEREQAIELCSRAINLEGATQEDYLRLAELITQKPLALSALEIQDLDAIVKHLRGIPGQEGPAAVVECRLGVKLEDVVRLQSCTPVLGKLSPNDPHTLTFLWSYAMMRKDYGEAKSIVKAMEVSSMARPALAKVKGATDKASAWWRRPFSDWRYAAGVVALIALVVGGLFLLRRRLALAPGAGAGPGPAAAT